MPALYRRTSLLQALPLLAAGERSLQGWLARQRAVPLLDGLWRQRGIDPRQAFMDVDDPVSWGSLLP
ncbi:MAG: hypothetical protein QJR00_01775 [Bacillota bacterium]|nr:hypothetical protein [Bacillota bacterium]